MQGIRLWECSFSCEAWFEGLGALGLCVCVYVHIHIYIYIYVGTDIERDADRGKDRHTS